MIKRKKHKIHTLFVDFRMPRRKPCPSRPTKSLKKWSTTTRSCASSRASTTATSSCARTPCARPAGRMRSPRCRKRPPATQAVPPLRANRRRHNTRHTLRPRRKRRAARDRRKIPSYSRRFIKRRRPEKPRPPR